MGDSENLIVKDGVTSEQDEKAREDSERESKFDVQSLTVDASCQTDFVVITEDLPELKRRMALAGSSSEEPLTTESIAEAAQSVLNKSGWMYDHRTGTYFDYNTNLYYYPQTRLYYSYKNGCYYRYNQETQKYEFHYQLEAFRNKSRNLHEKDSKSMAKKMKQTFPPLKKLKIQFKDNEKTSEWKTRASEQISGFRIRPCQGESSGMLSHKANAVVSETNSKDHLSDSERCSLMKRGRKYHICRNCAELTTNSCCLEMQPAHSKETELQRCSCSDSEIEFLSVRRSKYSHCQICKSLALSACCDEVDSWMTKAAAQSKSGKRKRGGRKRRRKRRRGCAQSSDSSSVEKEYENTSAAFDTVGTPNKDDQADLTPSQVILTENELNYTFDVDAGDVEFEPAMDQEFSVIPCIRAMVTSSDSLKIGELYLITCNGAVIGSEDQCDIQIPESGVSGKHATISYSSQQKNYFITDLGSELGTTLNSTSKCNPGTETVLPTPISHKSILLIGSCIFVLHLHLGYETCDDCEPGQIQALLGQDQPSEKVYAISKQEKEALRRSQLKSMKKKYDLHQEHYKQKEPLVGTCYTDRAAQRRCTVGSDNPYEKNEMPTSYETELAEDNKGHQMLKKMGWRKGKSIGKSQKGITAPIKPEGSGKGKLGLGFGAHIIDDT